MTRHTRVLFATAALTMGGLERQLVLLAANLPDAFEPRIWAVDGGPFERVSRDAGIPVSVAGRSSRFDVRPVVDLNRLVRSWQPAVVHSWHWMSTAAAVPVCGPRRVPLLDGSIRTGRPPNEILRTRVTTLRAARLVVANSQAGLDAWGIGSKKGRVVYNGFDPERLRLCEHHPDPRHFSVVMCGRMHAHKDWRALIGAARLLVSGDPHEGGCEWRFLLVGDGPLRGELMAEAADLADKGAVQFLDGGLEVLPIVARADVGVLMTDPSFAAEGCSNAILEYMACGLPVVCCDSGGNREVLSHGVTGYLVPPGDARALAERLKTLRGQPEMRARMGREGRARLERDFSLERMVAEFIGVYREALEHR